MAMDIPHQLREACEAVRRKDFPLADLIPTLQCAADVIDSLRRQLHERGQTIIDLQGRLFDKNDEVATLRRMVPTPPTGVTRVVDGKKVRT